MILAPLELPTLNLKGSYACLESIIASFNKQLKVEMRFLCKDKHFRQTKTDQKGLKINKKFLRIDTYAKKEYNFS